MYAALRTISFVSALEKNNDEKYFDDLSGKPLIPEMVRRARLEEIGELGKHGVYEKVPISECWNRTGNPPIGTRWVDVNKGDDNKPDYRSRLVAQELNTCKREDLFAATPPLEAKKLLFSLAVTAGIGFSSQSKLQGYNLDFIDVRRAYFHAPARRLVYVRLPPEDNEHGMCGKLLKALCGTRDAAQNWEHAYIEFIESVGFRSGLSTPCIFHHAARDIRVVVHGDDFTVLDWRTTSIGLGSVSRRSSRSNSVGDLDRRTRTTSQSVYSIGLLRGRVTALSMKRTSDMPKL